MTDGSICGKDLVKEVVFGEECQIILTGGPEDLGY